MNHKSYDSQSFVMSLSLAFDWDVICSVQEQMENTFNHLCPVRQVLEGNIFVGEMGATHK